MRSCYDSNGGIIITRFKLGTNEQKVIRTIGLGAMVFAAAGSPRFSSELIKIAKRQGLEYLKKLIKNLEDKRVVYLSGDKIKLTKRGRELLKEICLFDVEIKKMDKWDGVWRLVSYDIPEKYKKTRNVFRRFLERNDFVPLHKSLWVLPYECKDEVAVFAKNISAENDVIYMITDHIPLQEEMIEYYHLY